MAEKASAVAQKDLNQVESKLGLEEQTEGQDLEKAIEEAEAEIRDRET
jgi:hypothetical protein